MARTSSRTGTVAATAGTGTGPTAADPPMTPAAALARHVEWLDFALGAATAEEAWRRDRLAKATKRNRAKREERLAEVVGEVKELTALIAGIRNLEQRAARPTRARAGAPATSTADGAPRRRGRPRKNPLPEATAPAAPSAPAAGPTADAASAGDGAPRRRGRPRKNSQPAAPPAPARRPGRPRAAAKTPPAG